MSKTLDRAEAPAPKRAAGMQKVTGFFTELMRRYLPDPFVFAIILTILTVVLAVVIEGQSIADVTESWGKGFWSLLAFTTQMAVILAMGSAYRELGLPDEKRLSGPAGFRGKTLPVPVVKLKELVTLAIGQDRLDLLEIAFEGIFELHALSADDRHGFAATPLAITPDPRGLLRCRWIACRRLRLGRLVVRRGIGGVHQAGI